MELPVINPDPVAAYVLKSVAARLEGDIDTAEEWLNAAAAFYRASGQPNESRLYRAESRRVAYARDPVTSDPGETEESSSDYPAGELDGETLVRNPPSKHTDTEE